MPFYQGYCSKCGEYEFHQSIHLDAPSICLKCGKTEFKRLISRTTFVLRGSGWSGGINGDRYNTKVKEIEKGLLKEEIQLKSRGHVLFPEGTTREGEII